MPGEPLLIDEIASALEDEAPRVEDLLNAIWSARHRMGTDGSEASFDHRSIVHVQSAEQLVGTAWEMLRMAVEMLRAERPPLTEEQRSALAATDKFLADNR